MDSTTREIVEVFDRQNSLNNAVMQALEAISLQADKYDEQIASLVAGLDHLVKANAALRGRVERLERIARTARLSRELP